MNPQNSDETAARVATWQEREQEVKSKIANAFLPNYWEDMFIELVEQHYKKVIEKLKADNRT